MAAFTLAAGNGMVYAAVDGNLGDDPGTLYAIRALP
jgi:hypothetical protein